MKLTARQVEILRHVASGDTNDEVANRLHIAVGTMKSHMKHITTKLGARSRTHAVVLALHGGLLSFEEICR